MYATFRPIAGSIPVDYPIIISKAVREHSHAFGITDAYC